MMKESRPFASLSSSLLARKGHAKPAMRPSVAHHAEDLGWNDMGHDHRPEVIPVEADVPVPVQYQEEIEASFVPATKPEPIVAAPVEATVEEVPIQLPEVNAVEAEIVRPMRFKSRVVKSRVARNATPAKEKVAFTLRLDAERHLRLRLGCTLANRSAQQIVTDALDAFLEAIPQINELAVQIPPTAMNRRC